MLETLFTYQKTIARHQRAPLLNERERYLQHCVEQGYSKNSLKKIADILLLAVKYLPVSNKIISIESIKKASIRWRQSNRNSLSKRWLPKSKKYFIFHITQWLMFVEKLQKQDKKKEYFPKYLHDYIHYMRNERGFSEATIKMRGDFIQIFLSYLRDNHIHLSALNMKDVDRFFSSRQKNNRYSRCSIRMNNSHLRAFLLYAEQHKLCKRGLREAILLPRVYRNESLPVSPTRHEVYQIVASANGNRPKDIRNVSVLLKTSFNQEIILENTSH